MLTLSEQIADSSAVVLVQWSGGKMAKDKDPGSTEFEIIDVAKTDKADSYEKGAKITLTRYRAGTPSDLYLLLGTKNQSKMEWGSPLEMTKKSFEYIRNVPPSNESPQDRLRYFAKFLEVKDTFIADDAYGEFAKADYKQVKEIAKEFSRDKLREWLSNEKLQPGRRGLYGMMLGLCGNSEDEQFLKTLITTPSAEFRIGIDGVMGGYLLLTGEKGLLTIEETKLIDKKVSFSETYAGMNAVRFMWDYERELIGKERLRASMRKILDRPELADLVIADLARWKDWSIQEQLMGMYGQEPYDLPPIKRAIVRYLVAGTRDDKGDEGAQAKHVLLAKKYLAELEEKDPKTVSEAKKFLFLK